MTALDSVLQTITNSKDPGAKAKFTLKNFNEMESQRQRLIRAIKRLDLPLTIQRDASTHTLLVSKETLSNVELFIDGETQHLDAELLRTEQKAQTKEPEFSLDEEEKRMRQLLREQGMTDAEITEFLIS